jgi:hypothetical protein
MGIKSPMPRSCAVSAIISSSIARASCLSTIRKRHKPLETRMTYTEANISRDIWPLCSRARLKDRVLLHLKVGFSLPPLVNGQTPGLKRTRPRHTTRRDNLVHLGHEVAVIDRRQSQPEYVHEEGSLFLIDVHIIVVVPLRVVTSVCSGCSSHLLPVFHGVWSKKLWVNFQILIIYRRHVGHVPTRLAREVNANLKPVIPIVIGSIPYGGEEHPMTAERPIVIPTPHLPLKGDAVGHNLKPIAETRRTRSATRFWHGKRRTVKRACLQ